MKKLKVIDYSKYVKESNTAGSIPFIALENGAFVGLKDDEKAQMAIKNESGLIKKVNVSCDSNQIFNLSTKNISNLPPDTYYAELWITHADDTVSIFPDEDFAEFTINANAEAIIGEAIPVESVNSIKDDLIKALTGKVDINANVAIKIGNVTTGTQANVTNEVVNGENVLSFTIPQGKQGPQGIPGQKGDKGDIGPQGEPGKNGQSATIKVGTVTESDSITTPQITNSGDNLNAIFDFVFPKIKDIVESPTVNSAIQTASDNGWKTTQIKDNDDLNNYLTSGFYLAPSGININNMCPNSATPFGLIVLQQTSSSDNSILQIGIDYTYRKAFMRTYSSWGWGQWCIVSASLIRDTPIACPGFQYQSNMQDSTSAYWYSEYIGSVYCYHVLIKFLSLGNIKPNTDVAIFSNPYKVAGNDNFLQALNVNTHEFMGVYRDDNGSWHIVTTKGINKNDMISIQGSFINNIN